jgi:hypothetical protein
MAEVHANLGCLGMGPSEVYANLGWPGEGVGVGARGAPIAVIAVIADIARDRKNKTAQLHANSRLIAEPTPIWDDLGLDHINPLES